VAAVAGTLELRAEPLRRALRHELVLDVAVPFAVTRLALLVVGFLAAHIVVPFPGVPLDWRVPTDHPIVDLFIRWDAHWYLEIVREGYAFDPSDQSSVAFFPLYPLLARAVAAILGLAGSELGRAFALLIVSNAALVAGAIVLHRFVRELYGRAAAARAVLLVLVFPTTLFLSAGYAESLFLALSVASLHEAWHGRWWTAGLFGAGVALTRPFGVLIAIPLAIEWFMANRGRGFLRADAISVALPVAGLGAYAAFLGLAFGDPLAFVHVQTEWDRDLGVPWATFQAQLDGPLTVHAGLSSAVDLAGGLFAVVIAAVGWRYLRPSHAAFLTLVVVAILATGTLLSIWRFLGSLFPVFMLLAFAMRHPVIDRSIRLMAPTIAGLAMAVFAQHYWVS
jgi:hypothetical protein